MFGKTTRPPSYRNYAFGLDCRIPGYVGLEVYRTGRSFVVIVETPGGTTYYQAHDTTCRTCHFSNEKDYLFLCGPVSFG